MPATVSGAFVEDHRTMMSNFPTGVAVVTCADGEGRPYGLTCSSLASVTLEPPTLLVCLAVGSRTLATVARRGAFAVNLLHERAAATAKLFATPGTDRFAAVGWRPTAHGGLPWLVQDTLAVAECELGDITVVGSHAVVFGAVEAITLFEDMPLLYGRRRFTSWPEEEM